MKRVRLNVLLQKSLTECISLVRKLFPKLCTFSRKLAVNITMTEIDIYELYINVTVMRCVICCDLIIQRQADPISL